MEQKELLALILANIYKIALTEEISDPDTIFTIYKNLVYLHSKETGLNHEMMSLLVQKIGSKLIFLRTDQLRELKQLLLKLKI